MNFFCRIFGHTWVPRTLDSNPQWNTTKAMQVLMPSAEGETRYFDACQRCGLERDVDLGRSFPDAMSDIVDEERIIGHP